LDAPASGVVGWSVINKCCKNTNKPLFLLDAQPSSVVGGKGPNGCARLKKSHFLINYFLNSNNAGPTFNLTTTVAGPLYSVYVMSPRFHVSMFRELHKRKWN
jgi:hypothetical protein